MWSRFNQVRSGQESTAMQTTIGTDVIYAAGLLRNGEVVAIPTETVYGLAANALDETAVRKIYTIKNRPLYNPLIVHIAGVDQAHTLSKEIPVAALTLLYAFSPGPLTVLLPRNERVPDIVTAGLPHVAVRIPDHPLTLTLLRECGVPLAAPSANPFGYISPTTAAHVSHMLGGKIPYILDGGPCTSGIESTIIGFPDGVATIFRQGVIPQSAIEKIIGPVHLHTGTRPQSPGMLPSHYSPHTPLVLCSDVDAEIARHTGVEVGVITYNAYSPLIPAHQQLLLCTGSDLAAAASNLYAALHDMDARGYPLIIVKKLPDEGIGTAINDRLQRAAMNKTR
jgi:L-threonylcarbamoyladenylate synthase